MYTCFIWAQNNEIVPPICDFTSGQDGGHDRGSQWQTVRETDGGKWFCGSCLVH